MSVSVGLGAGPASERTERTWAPTIAALVRLGRARVAAVVAVAAATLLVAALLAATTVVPMASGNSNGRWSADASAMMPAGLHATVTVGVRRAGPDPAPGVGLEVFAAVALVALAQRWSSACSSTSIGQDRRRRWRARLVGAPPTFS